MIEHKCEQGSAEWDSARSGVFTASNAEVVIPLKRGSYSAKRNDYQYRLAVETILRKPVDDIDPGTPKISRLFWPARGINMEDEAVEALKEYAAKRQIKLGKMREVGFCTTDDGRIGASPDRLIDKSKISVEVKCPASWTQAEYLDAGDDFWLTEYYAQVQCQMLVTGYQQAILFSYHPRMPAVYRYTQRDETFISMLRAEIDKFNTELRTLTEKLRTLPGWKPFEDE